MKLYGYRNGRTLRALWTLEEVAARYEYVEVDVLQGEGRAPWFLHINPAGKVPVLVDGELIVTESAAICMHLADKYPASGLLPALGSPARTECYRWISFLLTELDTPLWTIAKHRFGLPVERRVPGVLATARWEFGMAVGILEGALVGKRRYLVGDSLTIADILAGHILLWARGARLALDSVTLAAYLEALLQRPALVRAREVARGDVGGPDRK